MLLPEARSALCEEARKTADGFCHRQKTVSRTRAFYLQTLRKQNLCGAGSDSLWLRAKRALAREMDIKSANIAHAASDSVFPRQRETRGQ